MSLGTTGLADFTPRRHGTASSILNAPLPEAPKKTTQLQLRISDDIYQLFKDLCEKNNTDVSKALRAYMNAAIARGSL